jgi:hypothetical protein
MLCELKPGFKHYEGGKRLEAGALLEMTEERLEALKDRFVPVAAASGAEPPAPTDWFEAVAAHWSAVAKIIRAQIDPESVRGIRAAEVAGQGRDGVLKACDDRLAELEGG